MYGSKEKQVYLGLHTLFQTVCYCRRPHNGVKSQKMENIAHLGAQAEEPQLQQGALCILHCQG